MQTQLRGLRNELRVAWTTTLRRVVVVGCWFLAVVAAHAGDGARFFPGGAFYPKDNGDDYARVLLRFQEKPLPGAKAITYRLLYQPSFGDDLLFRLEVTGDWAGILTVKRLKRIPLKDTADTDYRYKLSVMPAKKVSARAMRNFLQFLDTAKFKDLPTEILGDWGLDGSIWLLEMYDGAVHHVTSRWSPMPPHDPKGKPRSNEETSLNMACLYLFMLGGGENDEIY
jgi:hypothetical protein